MGYHKYGNGRTKIENGTGRNENISVHFQPYPWGRGSTPLRAGVHLVRDENGADFPLGDNGVGPET